MRKVHYLALALASAWAAVTWKGFSEELAPVSPPLQASIHLARVAPAWSQEMARSNVPGISSQLSQFSVHAGMAYESPLGSLNRQFFSDTAMVRDLRTQFERYSYEYDVAAAWSSLTGASQEAHFARMSQLAKSAMQSFGNRYLTLQVNSVRGGLLRLGVKEKALTTPVAIGGATYFLATGKPIQVQIPKVGQLMLRADVPGKQAEFQLSTSWFSTAFAYNENAAFTRDATIAVAPELNLEKFKISFSSKLPVLNVDMGLSFASSTGTISAAISRELLIPQLRGTLSTTRSVRPTQGRYGEESFQVGYAHSF